MNISRNRLAGSAFIALAAIGTVFLPAAIASEEGMFAAEQVSELSYDDFMANWLYTHIGDDRGPNGPEHDMARDNIASLMEGYGLTVELEAFQYWGETWHNVVGTKVGTVYPDQEYIIGAHYDSVSNPGADDNASGVALVLEAARIITQYDSQYTIRFIAFDMEETGLNGSEAYVDDHYTDDILGMISADMVAYDTGTNECNIYGRSASNPIKNTVADAVSEYGDGLTPVIGGDTPYSDHAPFESAGFQACLFIEREVWNNPFYHTQDDNYENPDNLNFPYAVKMTRSIVGWLVDEAGVLVEMNECPADFDGDGDVDTADLLFLLAAWGTGDGDIDGDGDTDTADLLELLAAWGECP
ncbi:MAG: M20/M25/M40 family metallo-hydrolase [Planctomycetota bacterium]|nr:M20/M25/M40 family metallo-hydrolase [Planctomycetota bacterium]